MNFKALLYKTKPIYFSAKSEQRAIEIAKKIKANSNSNNLQCFRFKNKWDKGFRMVIEIDFRVVYQDICMCELIGSTEWKKPCTCQKAAQRPS